MTDNHRRAASASDVIERPATGVVLAIASGPRAGEMFGTNDTEFFLGFHPDCVLRFSHDQYPNSGAKVLCRRGPEGWIVARVIGETTFVNQRLLEDKLVLRSGDVIRLSARGPDVQFTMQSGGLAIKSLASRFLPAQSNPEVGQHPAIPVDTGAATRREAAAKKFVVATAIPATSVGGAPNPGKPTGNATYNEASKGSWLSIKGWNNKWKKIVIGLVGTIVIAIVAILIRSKTMSKPIENSDNKAGETAILSDDSEAKTESEFGENTVTPIDSTSTVEEPTPPMNP